MKKLLLLSANPKDTTQLRVDEEVREIREGLRRSRQREDFVIETALAVRYRDIRRTILDHEPNIVHFSGHGEGKEGLIFEDETGNSKFIEAEALANLFELFADSIECVVLNACYSDVQAKAIAQHIPYVIGMDKAIGDKAAIEFAVGFYDGLGAGKSVEFAYKLGRNSIEIAGIPERLTPQLLSNPDVIASQKKTEKDIPIQTKPSMQGSTIYGFAPDSTGSNVVSGQNVQGHTIIGTQNNYGVPSSTPFSGNAEALELWTEKLTAYRREEAISSDPEKKFQLKQLIKECQEKIEELGG
ncbi:CHAT domain-containing protein [Crocosphaera sp. Alani8]|uniref:CHAT domain-containing protein n=1 Tax=Crocosphaera sp. Alani8 TaxID=3038952 RepID=UPI00313EA93B